MHNSIVLSYQIAALIFVIFLIGGFFFLWRGKEKEYLASPMLDAAASSLAFMALLFLGSFCDEYHKLNSFSPPEATI